MGRCLIILSAALVLISCVKRECVLQNEIINGKGISEFASVECLIVLNDSTFFIGGRDKGNDSQKTLLLKSTDGGKNWKSVLDMEGSVSEMKFINGFIFINIYYYDVINQVKHTDFMFSKDFGNTWHEIKYYGDKKESIHFGPFINEKEFYLVVTIDGRIKNIKTTNGGLKWDIDTIFERPDLSSFQLFDGEDLFGTSQNHFKNDSIKLCSYNLKTQKFNDVFLKNGMDYQSIFIGNHNEIFIQNQRKSEGNKKYETILYRYQKKEGVIKEFFSISLDESLYILDFLSCKKDSMIVLVNDMSTHTHFNDIDIYTIVDNQIERTNFFSANSAVFTTYKNKIIGYIGDGKVFVGSIK